MAALATSRRPLCARAALVLHGARRAVLIALGVLIVAGGGLLRASLAQQTTQAAAPAAAPIHVPWAVRRELNRAQSLLRAQVAHLPHEDDIELLRESEAVVLRIPSRVLFRPDSKSLLQADAATARVLALPERLLRRRRRLTARIEVYTDNIGGTSLNLSLSQQRAQTLLQVLQRAGISAERLQAWGGGLRDAIASNDTPEGRMRNRRVEFVFERAGTRQPGGSPGGSGDPAGTPSGATPGTAPGTATTRAPLRPAQAAAPAGA
jgi:outer membrane protein OmpA-like peptidoglycan-associated protein